MEEVWAEIYELVLNIWVGEVKWGEPLSSPGARSEPTVHHSSPLFEENLDWLLLIWSLNLGGLELGQGAGGFLEAK